MIELVRGDSGHFKFQRLDFNGNVLSTVPSAIYFTVKWSFDVRYVILRKTIEDMTKDTTNWWHFSIDPSDTEQLAYGSYVYDIEVTDEGEVTTISRGTLKIGKEATWRENKDE